MKAHLLITNGQLAGTVVPVGDGQTLTFGRSDMSDIVIPDGKASRIHCKVQNAGSAVEVFDLNSSNGTYCNQRRIERQSLKPGDEVMLGETILIFEVAPATEADIQPPTGSQPQQQTPQAASRSPVQAPPQDDTAMPAAKAGKPTDASFVRTHRFCAKCGRVIPKKEVSDNRAREVEGKWFCADCVDPYLGRTLGNYRIVSKIGQGAMGIVFLAEHTLMERPAAIKILFEYLTLNRNMVKRFVREAKSGASLNHPNLVSVYDVGECDGTYYIAMEFVDGVNLSEFLTQNGPPPMAHAYNIFLQMANVLQYAHEKKLVHRDVKPENIILGKDGIAKLIDMGTAKSLQDSGLSELTKTGMGIGTINFMSPEQIFDAKNVDHRADMYAMGATFYFVLTTKLPFQAKSPKEFLAKVNSEKVEPAKRHNPATPDSLCRIIEKMMAKAPKDRYQTPKELIVDLEAIRPEMARELHPTKTLPPE